MIHIFLEVLTFGLDQLVHLIIATVTFRALAQHVGLVEAYTRFLQLLEVLDVVQTLEHVILKLAHLTVLLHPILHELLQFAFETILAQNQIIDDQ